MKISMKTVVYLIILTALLGFGLVLVNMSLGDRRKAAEGFFIALEKERELVKSALREPLLLLEDAYQLGESAKKANEQFTLIGDGISSGGFPSNSVTRIDKAREIWKEALEKIQRIRECRDTIQIEGANFLRAAPQLKQASNDVALMLESRKHSRTTIADSQAQVELIDRLVLLVSSYLAIGSDRLYKEAVNGIAVYSATLLNFASSDSIVHASILALIADNQLFWKGFKESITKTLESRKTALEETKTLIDLASALDQELSQAADEAQKEGAAVVKLLEHLRSAFLLIIAFLIGFNVSALIVVGKKADILAAG
ncbi:MAG: hypothetical protein LBT81_05430 [Helicobacteraceae bacterium]|nr:hypothetical protein [Helicobacteraceae bacterium]